MPYFLNVGVDNQVTWPRRATEVLFEGRKLTLLPKTTDHTTSVHVDLNGISLEDAHTLINRFLSILSWCDDNYAIYEGGWAGNPAPTPVPKRNLAFVCANEWPFDRKIPSDPRARIALAVYREARNAEQNHQVSYAVLGYYKIMDLKIRRRGNARIWIRENYSKISSLKHLEDMIERFDKARGAIDPHNYLYSACRSAVAHMNEPYINDPDEFNELRRLHVAADLLRELARVFIKDELKVSTYPFDGT